MKKIKYWSSLTTLIMLVFSLGLVGPAYGDSSVTTTLNRDAGGGGAAPIIKAKWEMNGPLLLCWEQTMTLMLGPNLMLLVFGMIV